MLKLIDFPPPIGNLAIPCVLQLLADFKPTFKVHTVTDCIRMFRPADFFCFIVFVLLLRVATGRKSVSLSTEEALFHCH